MRLKFPILLLIPALAAMDDGARFATVMQLVIEPVTVRDKHGEPVENLAPEDFTLTENGRPQRLKIVAFQRLDAAAPFPAINTVQPPGQKQITFAGPAVQHYPNRRLLAFYFDRTTMPASAQLRAFDSARTFIRTQMAPADIVAVLQFTDSGLELLDDFTGNRDELLKTMEALRDNAGNARADSAPEASEFDAFSVDRQLAALQTATRMLAPLMERKSLIYFTGSLPLTPINNRAQLQAAWNDANRANVALYPIEASSSGPDREALTALASQTGGKALFNPADLAAGILQAQKDAASYYLLGYYQADLPAFDGKFHSINISLNRSSAKLEYRHSLYTDLHRNVSVDQEQKLEDALNDAVPTAGFITAGEVDYFRLSEGNYFVPVTIKIPSIELFLAKRRGAERTQIDFLGEVKNAQGTTVRHWRDRISIDIAAKTSRELAVQPPIEYDASLNLTPGAYTLKLLAREADTTHAGTYINTFVIPDLSQRAESLPISSVILSSQRSDVKDAPDSAGKVILDVSPLVQDGRKYIPSVTRVFKKSQDLYVYLQAYQPGSSQLTASVALYRGQTKAYQTPDLKVVETNFREWNTKPLSFAIPLQDLPPGQYDCHLTVADPNGRKAVTWQAPIMVTP